MILIFERDLDNFLRPDLPHKKIFFKKSETRQNTSLMGNKFNKKKQKFFFSNTTWVINGYVFFRLKMAKMTILSQKTAYNVTTIDSNWKNYMRSENLKQRALIWDQSQLCSSIRSWDISKARWILGLKMAKTQKPAYNVTAIDSNWKDYMRSEYLKQRALIWDQSQLCSSIRSWDISKTRWILGLKMAKMTILLQKTAYNMVIIGWNWKDY